MVQSGSANILGGSYSPSEFSFSPKQMAMGHAGLEGERSPSAMDTFLGSFGGGMGQGFGEGVNQAIKQHLGNSILDKALAGMPQGMPIDEQLQQFSRLSPEAQASLLPLMKYRIGQEQAQTKALQKQQQQQQQPTPRQQIDRERLYNQLTKKYNDQPEKQDELLKFGNVFLEQGLTPFQAFSQAQKVVDKREKAMGSLDKMPEAGGGFFGFGKNKSEKDKQVKARIHNARKSGVLTDDDVVMKLLEKGYGPEDIEKYGLEPSDEFMSTLADELAQEQDTLGDIGSINTKAAPRSQRATQQASMRNQNQSEQTPAGMPDPIANAGRQIRDNQTGKILISNGKNWIPQ